MKFLKNFLKIFGNIILLLLVVTVVFSLFTPVYNFDEPQPFSGEILHNPYQDLPDNQWHKANFHAHTKNYGGVTNGKDTPFIIDSVYRFFGFDYAGISDYMTVNKGFAKNSNFIPSYEHGFGLFKIHQLCLGASEIHFVDYPLFQTLSMKQYMLNKLHEHSILAIPAHPEFVAGGYFPDNFKYLSNYKLMEVVNGYVVSEASWDTALSNGHRVYLLGDDDTHDVLRSNDVANCFTVVNCASLTQNDILTALVEGHAYAVDFRIHKGETLDEKRASMDTTLPRLLKAQLCGDTLLVEVSRKAKEIVFVGQNGKVLQTDTNTAMASYIIQPEDTYVRVVTHHPDRTELYLNPITRQTTPIFVEHTLYHFCWWKSVLKWLFGIIVLASYVIFSYLCKIWRIRKV